MVVLVNAMSGGLVPSGALLMSDEIYQSVYGSLRRSLIHTSTYSENGLAMRVGLAVLDALSQEKCDLNSALMGNYVRQQLRNSLSNFEMVADIRGEGLFTGIEFRAPKKLSLRLSFKAFSKIHRAMFGQFQVMRLFPDHGIPSPNLRQ
jgi:ornithine--oxo-acid transaminase